MKSFLMRLTVTMFSLLAFSLSGHAGQLDDYYLAAFGEQAAIRSGSVLEKALLLPADEAPHCGTPLKHDLQRDWNNLESATQKVLAKQLAAPVLANEATFDSSHGRYRIH